MSRWNWYGCFSRSTRAEVAFCIIWFCSMKLFGLLFKIKVGARSKDVDPRKEVKNCSKVLPKLD